MQIMPAIDLLGGKCVRLIQGRYDRVIHYEKDPVDQATGFKDAGAQWVHVVDLDAARTGELANLEGLNRIAEVGLSVQFGGGVRDAAAVEAALNAGAQRVIIGTRALEDMDWFKTLVHTPDYVERICLGLDARLGKLATRAWTQETERTAIEVVRQVDQWPLAAIVYTDIGRDGMLLGPNIEAIRDLAVKSTVPVVACGGVSEVADVKSLAQLQLEGVVIGRALYEGAVDLREAIRIASDEIK